MAKKYKSVLSKEDQEKLEFLYKAGKSISDLVEIFTLNPDNIKKEILCQGMSLNCENYNCQKEANDLEWFEDLDLWLCKDCAEKMSKQASNVVVFKPDPKVEDKPETADFVVIDDGKPKTDKDVVIEVETFYKSLETKLTDLEIKDLGQQLAKTEWEKSTLELEKKMAADKFKQDIDGKDAKIRELYRFINRGTEFRDYLCYWKYNDPETGKKSLYKFQTKEHIETTQMSDEERHDIFKNN